MLPPSFIRFPERVHVATIPRSNQRCHKDLSSLQGDCHAVVLRYDARRIVCGWACCGHLCAVDVTVCLGQWLTAPHLLAVPARHRSLRQRKAPPAHYWGQGHRDRPQLGIHTSPPSFTTFTSPKRSVSHFCSRLCCQLTICTPIAPLSAVALSVGCSSREVVLFCIFAYGAVGRKLGC